MRYFLFPLTFKEQDNPSNKGYRYALENKSRWIDMGEAKDEVNTYDRGTTNLVYKNVAYNIFKDYVNIDEKYRVYIGCDMNLSYDRLSEEEETSSWGSTSNTQKILKKQTIDSSKKIVDAISRFKGDEGTLTLKAGTYSGDIETSIPYIFNIVGAMADKTAIDGTRAVDTIDNESIISGAIKFTGEAYILLDGLTFTKNASINLVDFRGSLNIRNCKFVGLTRTNAISVDANSELQLTIRRCYFSKSSVADGISIKGKLLSSDIVHNKFVSTFCSGKIISLSDSYKNANININRNECDKPNLLAISLTEDIVTRYILASNTFKSLTGAFVDITLNSKDDTVSFRNTSVTITGIEIADNIKPVNVISDIPEDEKGRYPLIVIKK